MRNVAQDELGELARFPKNLTHLWIVDDSEDDREMLQDALRSLAPEAELHVFSGGKAFLEAATALSSAECAASLVFLDLEMPVVDGRDVLEALRARPEEEQLRVLLVSGNHADELEALTAKHAILGYVSKTDTVDELVAAVAAVLPRVAASL